MPWQICTSIKYTYVLRRYVAKILPIQRKTLFNYSVNDNDKVSRNSDSVSEEL